MFDGVFMFFVDNSTLLMFSNALLLLLLVLHDIRSSKKIWTLSADISSLKYDLQALCRGASNGDRRLDHLDSQIKRILERQEKFDTSDVVKREYDHAIRAIKNGASFEHLVNMHGLSHAEAKLLISLHAETCEA